MSSMYNFTPFFWQGGRAVDGICISNKAAFLSAYFFFAALLLFFADKEEFVHFGFLVASLLLLALDADVWEGGVLRWSFADVVA